MGGNGTAVGRPPKLLPAHQGPCTLHRASRASPGRSFPHVLLDSTSICVLLLFSLLLGWRSLRGNVVLDSLLNGVGILHNVCVY